ncbi:inner membrane-spanning protein YciB [Pseudoalteromonas denitrificans]|uniref:Inner membrane-spanning protein YciB n=1 Tax=Pseudoalteromonas denitrificans DSM 6059 TaxID=1123010 RepID=A0A1I1R2V8_9GAMM|nr:inner membrane-spanning protein YciB [Pseudoalteromonas denitrificans]SFD25863.1 intracellular septation protein [Pseudoalteromonas denitrificans DSM 6059]
MHALIEYIPLILFFATFKLVDIFWATGVLIGTSTLQVAFYYFKDGKVATKTWVFFGIALVLGSMTLIFHDEAFIKWKATVIYFAFFLTLLVSRYLLKKNLMEKMLTSILKNASDTEQELNIPKTLWDKINLMWAAITLFISVLNIYIAYNFSLDFWVNFKVFGLMGITFVFIFITIMMLFKYLPEEEPEKKK